MLFVRSCPLSDPLPWVQLNFIFTLLSVGGYFVCIEMDADDGKRFFHNAQRSLAYASMDAEKKAELLAKKWESRRRRLQSDRLPSGMLGRSSLDTAGLKLLESYFYVTFSMLSSLKYIWDIASVRTLYYSPSCC